VHPRPAVLFAQSAVNLFATDKLDCGVLNYRVCRSYCNQNNMYASEPASTEVLTQPHFVDTRTLEFAITIKRGLKCN